METHIQFFVSCNLLEIVFRNPLANDDKRIQIPGVSLTIPEEVCHLKNARKILFAFGIIFNMECEFPFMLVYPMSLLFFPFIF